MRAAWLCLIVLCTFAGHLRADEIELDRLETEDLDLLYFDPPQTYLTPYAARAALNSIEFQKRIFEWKPWEKVTLLLKDFDLFSQLLGYFHGHPFYRPSHQPYARQRTNDGSPP